MLKARDLDRYDLFYRMVGVPFIELDIEDFFTELTELQELYKLKCEKEGRIVNLDNVPYVDFLEFYKTKPKWEVLICNEESPFMKLMQLDNLFFVKKVIHREKG